MVLQCHSIHSVTAVRHEPIGSGQASLGLILQILQLLEPERGKVDEIHAEFHRYQTIATILSAASRVVAISTITYHLFAFLIHRLIRFFGIGLDSEALVCNAGHGARCLVLLAKYGLARVQRLEC